VPTIEAFAIKVQMINGKISLSHEYTECKWISQKECKDYEYTPGVAAIIGEFIKNKI
jgi:hypothetical protein